MDIKEWPHSQTHRPPKARDKGWMKEKKNKNSSLTRTEYTNEEDLDEICRLGAINNYTVVGMVLLALNPHQ